MQIAQGCQNCTTRDLLMHHPRISELQKNFGGTLKQGSPKNQNFTAGLHGRFPVMVSCSNLEISAIVAKWRCGKLRFLAPKF